MATLLGREVIHRAMSVFNHAIPGWEAITLRAMQNLIAPIPPPHKTSTASRANDKQQLTLASWNLPPYLFHTRAIERNKFILGQILDVSNPPDIICLQNVYGRIQEIILEDERIRSQYLTTNAVDTFRFTRVPVKPATMTLLSKKRFGSILNTKEGDEGKLIVDNVFRVKLDTMQEDIEEKKSSKKPQKRDALCVDIASPSSPGKVFRLMNVHLQSGDAAAKRKRQLELVNNLLRQPQISGGVIAGDFNAHSPHEHSVIENFKLLDAWVELHGSKNGDTWGVSTETVAGRHDKVVLLGAKPIEIELLQAGPTEYGFMWSNHCGLRSTFTI